MRKRWLAASAPPRTKAAAIRVTALALRSPRSRLPMRRSTVSSASLTRTAETAGNVLASALISAVSCAGMSPSVKVSVAISLCGAPAGDPCRDVAAEHVDGDAVADLEVEIGGGFAFERNERRPGVVGAPPVAGDDTRPVRDRRRVGDAAAPAQHPRR